MTTVDEIVFAIRALPLTERLRLAERVIHEAVADVPEATTTGTPAPGGDEQSELVEDGGLLIVKSKQTYPASFFDHRAVPKERIEI